MARLTEGVVTSLITPFQSRLDPETGWESEIDLFHLTALIRWQARCGVGAVAVAGWTGEGASLSRGERIELIRAAVAAKGAMRVLAHVGSPSTAKSVALALDAAAAGADALVLVTPFYNKPNLAGIRQHVEAVAKAAPIPLFLEFHEAATHQRFGPREMADLAAIEGIAGIVDHSSNPLHVECIGLTRRGTTFLAAHDPSAVASGLLGADGFFSSVANVAPAATVRLWQAANEGDRDHALALASLMLPLAEMLERHGVPALKRIAHERIGVETTVRLPLHRLDEAAEAEALHAAGVAADQLPPPIQEIARPETTQQ